MTKDTSMIACYHLLFLILLNPQDTLSKNYRTSTSHIGTFSERDIIYFDFNSDGSQLNLKLERSEFNTSVNLICTSFDQGTEIVIGGCNLTSVTQEETIYNNKIGYKFRFRRNTAYEFSKYRFVFNIDLTNSESLEIKLGTFSFYFPDFQNTCKLKNQNYMDIKSRFNLPILVTPCKSEEEKISAEIYYDDSLKWRLYLLDPKIITVLCSPVNQLFKTNATFANYKSTLQKLNRVRKSKAAWRR
ncbi:hypothetical protein RF11_03983 [Thelohanellus kitauei]|uniref:Uncharacterized protein n=1 Tax=Thelohanellus kitauei TaxID=669202 RepID=A0A0C2IV81_THEKT|nr:hypothetical protein RF11_03983 [Thelohanellus kitauei]